MKASELRIGNLVYLENDVWHDYKNMPMLVTGISTDGCKDEMFPNSTGSVTITLLDKSYDFSQMDEFIRPIPITEEWLLRFGFKRTYIRWFIGCSLVLPMQEAKPILQFIEFREDIDDISTALLCQIELSPEHKINVNIFNVHQLQNLYFALTGEELTVK